MKKRYSVMEKTFAMIKPDGVQRSLVGNIIARYEAKGLRVAGMKIMQVTEAQAAQHYAAPTFGELVFTLLYAKFTPTLNHLFTCWSTLTRALIRCKSELTVYESSFK